jgi:hypothetical protein
MYHLATKGRLWNLFKTHVNTKGEKQSIMIWKMCYVKGGGIWLIIHTPICLL